MYQDSSGENASSDSKGANSGQSDNSEIKDADYEVVDESENKS